MYPVRGTVRRTIPSLCYNLAIDRLWNAGGPRQIGSLCLRPVGEIPPPPLPSHPQPPPAAPPPVLEWPVNVDSGRIALAVHDLYRQAKIAHLCVSTLRALPKGHMYTRLQRQDWPRAQELCES